MWTSYFSTDLRRNRNPDDVPKADLGRICFEWRQDSAYRVEIVDYH